MNQLNAMRAFRCLVETASFSAAAEHLDTTHSTVSRHLQQLEALLGVRLVHRNTRRLSLTAAGQQYYEACLDILQRLDRADAALAQPGQVSGPLRVSAPLSIGSLELPHWLPAWRRAFPQVQLHLSCDDRLVDLVAEHIDVALRISPGLADTSLQARLLTRSSLVLVASAPYLHEHGEPCHPEHLHEHALLGFAGGGDWLLRDGAGELTRIAQGRGFKSDTISALHAAAVAGMGIAAFTETTVREDLRTGRLVRVLSDYGLGEWQYYALYPQTRHLPAQARAFIDFMARHYGDTGDAVQP
jgi:DNA-binding transcriptional LysR family regulator